MDPTTKGILIGTSVSLVSSVLISTLAHWFLLRLEKKRWDREQDAEKARLEREDKKEIEQRSLKKKEQLYEAYQNSLKNLLLLANHSSQGKGSTLPNEKRLEVIEEAQKSLSLLSLHCDDTQQISGWKFGGILKSFTQRPDESAEHMSALIREFALNDRTVFPEAPEKIEQDVGTFNLQIKIDEEFRRQQIIEGVVVPQDYSFAYNISALTRNQRELLTEIYFESMKRIPDNLKAPMPIFNPQSNEIIWNQGSWKAKLNPLTTEPQDIFTAWEKDCRAALEDAKKALIDEQDAK